MRFASALIHSVPLLWVLMLVPGIDVLRGLVEGGWYTPQMLHISGVWSVRLLALSLAVTPVLLILARIGRGQALGRWLLGRRKHFGLAAFVYAALHLAHYLREAVDLSEVWAQAQRLDYASGWLAFLVLAVLAATSNRAAQRKLGRRWKRIHRGVYGATALVFLHWWLFDIFVPMMWLWLWIIVATKAAHAALRLAPRRVGWRPMAR